MSRKLEDKIAYQRDMKDIYAWAWMLTVAATILIGVYGYFFDTTIIITGFVVFVLGTIVFVGMFNEHEKREEKLMDKLKQQNLEERIEELEQSF